MAGEPLSGLPHNGPMMTSVLRFLLRALLVAAGLVFAASLVAVFLVLLAAWSLRAAWARLTGRPVSPFIFHMGPRQAFTGFMHRHGQQPAASRTPRADAGGFARGSADVTDVEPKLR